MKKNYPKHLIYGLTVLLAAFLMMMGTASYSYAKKAKLSPDHQEFYNYARYLMTKGERKLFFGIPTDEERQKFIDYFWEIRDPNPETEENEFKIEIERRFEYVNRYLKEGPIPGYKTDRGRLYLILGPPTNRLENSLNTSFAREIWWYFANSDIYARFVDANGNGIYYMDTNWVSLKLLDEMERRKYYIVNKDEKENFETALLKFSLKYRPESKEVQINVNTRNLSYNESENSDVMISRIKVNLVVYDNKNKFFTHTEVKTVEISKEELLEKKSTVTFMVPLDLPKGKVKIDAIVTDFLGDAVMRKFFKIKN